MLGWDGPVTVPGLAVDTAVGTVVLMLSMYDWLVKTLPYVDGGRVGGKTVMVVRDEALVML